MALLEMRDPVHQKVPRRVLIILPNWLGDVVMTTPLIEYLCATLDAMAPAERPELHLAVRRPWASLFADDSRIGGLFRVERNGRHHGLAGIWRQAMDLRRGAYDAVLVCPPSLRSGLVAALAGIALRVGYDSDARGLFMNPALAAGPRGARHFACEMLDLGAALVSEWGLAAPALDAESLPTPKLVVSGSREKPASGALWIVAPGTTYGEAKVWPLERVADFIETAVVDENARVVLLGDSQASDFVAQLRDRSAREWSSQLDAGAEVTDLTGQTNLSQVVELMRQARVFVGNDSGLMHLAGALGVAAVGVFGSSNPAWTHPLGPRTAAVVATGFDCQPCYRQRCNQPKFCLETVAADRVMAVVKELLAAENTAGSVA